MTVVSGTAVKGAGAPRSTAAAQIKAQRRRYASAVLRSLSRTYAGRPAHEVQRVLASSMRPLGVRVNAGHCSNSPWRSPLVGLLSFPDHLPG